MSLASSASHNNKRHPWLHNVAYVLLTLSLLISGVANAHYCVMGAPTATQTEALNSPVADPAPPGQMPPCHQQNSSTASADITPEENSDDNCCDGTALCGHAVSATFLLPIQHVPAAEPSSQVHQQISTHLISGNNRLPYRPPILNS